VNRNCLVVFVSIAVCLVSVARAQEGGKPGRTVLDGVYTDAQARRGAEAYQNSCGKCHEGADVDGPPLTGDPFIDRWREDSLASLFGFIKANMPQDAPGKLAEPAYRDIVAYLLQANMYPVGGQELTAETLSSTELVGHSGPQPLPTNSLVRVVGCFAAGNGGSWMLNRAAEPQRTREPDHSTAEELRGSAAKALGTQTFRLDSLEDLTLIHPETFAGHKVQAKGVLIRQPNNDRIHVASLETVATACGSPNR
jgi:mono/diheme cytochrome c family protein